MADGNFDFWGAVLGPEGARDLAQHFLDLGPDIRAELSMFQGRDPAEVARTLTARAEPTPPPRSKPFLATTDGKLTSRAARLLDNILD